MARKKILCFILCFQLVISTGCWDRVELNDRAIWLATGWDVGEKEGVEITGQIVTCRISFQGKPFLVSGEW